MQSNDDYLIRARNAVRQNNYSGAHIYFATLIAQHPENGKLLTEFLEAMRSLRSFPLQDVATENAFTRFLPTQAAQRVMEQCFEKLKINPMDLDAVYRIGKLAQSSGWHGTVVAAFTDVLKISPGARAPGSKLGRELKFALGKAHYESDQCKAALDMLNEFQHDAAAPKEILQIIKDASADLASASFKQSETVSAHKIATPESVALATRSAQEVVDQEIRDLQTVLADEKTELPKVCAAAIKLSEFYVKAAQFEKALTALNKVRERNANSTEVDKRLVEVQVKAREHQIAKMREKAVGDSSLQPALEKLFVERDAFALKSYRALAISLPSDGEVKLKLGEALYAVWKKSNDENLMHEAIMHLQFEFKTTDLCNRAQLLLAECFVGVGVPAAAENVLADFLTRIDKSKNLDLYLEAQYLIGVVREKAEDPVGALNAYLAVISRNIRFKDTFQRLKRLEQRQSGTTAKQPA